MDTLVVGDLYNRLFHLQSSNPGVKVEYEVWTRIITTVPPDYRLPDYKALGLRPE